MLRKLRELRHILTRRMWTPHPFAGPAVIERDGVIRPAPGIVINSGLEQRSARLAHNQEVGCSNQPPATNPRPSVVGWRRSSRLTPPSSAAAEG